MTTLISALLFLSNAFAQAGFGKSEVLAAPEAVKVQPKLAANVNGVPLDLLVPAGQTVPDNILNCLTQLQVTYCDNATPPDCNRRGLLIVNKDLKDDLKIVFDYMREIKFPLTKIRPASQYKTSAMGWDDDEIMSDDNTSMYNPRLVAGKGVASQHAFGRAIDINPKCNPVVHTNGRHSPANGRRKAAGQAEPDCSMESAKGQLVVQKFLSLSNGKWIWGGTWKNPRDTQHFELPGPAGKNVGAQHCK